VRKTEQRQSIPPDPHCRPDGRFALRFWHSVNRVYTRAYHRIEVRTPYRIPATGAAILVCNHTSGLDPLLLQSVSPRVITWMAAKEFVEHPALNWFFRTIGAIPVARSGRDTASVRAAMRALHDGKLLGVFPEGRIEDARALLPFQDGVAQMAMKTGVSVYPAYLDGTQRNKPMLRAFLEAQDVRVAFGPPITFGRGGGDKDALPAATGRIRDAIGELMARHALTTPLPPAPVEPSDPPVQAPGAAEAAPAASADL
jgi:1-acyl-sn-glycerol-3-phosphate acyltransferase